MKKILACIFAVSVISTAAFTKNFFTQRFFEIRTGTELGASNNLFAANDIFQKEFVIDLPQLAQDCPDSGFNIRAGVTPSVALNIRVKDFHLGFSSGVELYESMSVGKDLFDFLGYGNSVGQTMNFTIDNDADLFAFSQIDLGFRVGKLRVKVQPAVFLPILSMRGGGAKATAVNGTDGSMNISVDMDLDVYSIAGIKKTGDGNNFSFDPEELQAALTKGYGFDLGAGLSWDLTKSFVIGADCRIPIIPGHLSYKANIQGGFDYKVKIDDFQNAQKTERKTTVTNTAEELAVHRPLKAHVYLDKNLLGTLFNAHAAAGLGIRRPFSTDAVFYPEYYLGFGINLIDLFKVGVSTEYRDQVFIHQLGTTLNVRLIQIDLGVSAQSSDFMKSMQVAGVGGYFYVSVGF